MEDFGLGFPVFVDRTDFARRFIREPMVVGLAGVAGVAGVSGIEFVLGISILRGRLASATASMVLSDIADAGASSRTGETAAFSTLLRVNIPRSPPFDSLLCTFCCFNGT